MKKLLLPVFILLIFTAFKSNSPATKTLTGIVKDKDSSKPLAGVSVSTPSGKVSILTDKSGKYSISITDTETTLKFAKAGYNSATIKLNGSTVINIALAQTKTSRDKAITKPDYPEKEEPSADMALSRLEGKAAGTAVYERAAVDAVRSSSGKAKSSSAKIKRGDIKRPTPERDRPQSNQLTAGEWNDLDNWDFWKDLMNNQEWSQNQSRWQFYTGNRVGVTLLNKQQQPLINYTITAWQNNQPMWKAQSNFEGKAELWPSLYNNTKADIVLTVATTDGKEIYKKTIPQNVRKLTVTLDRPADKIKNLDVLFMVDATGSMGDEIDYLKSELEDIIGRLNGKNQLNTRTSLVFYRDKGDEYLIRDFAFDSNLKNVKQNLSKQNADGGGDFEEAVEEAMENAIFQQQWSTTGTSAKLMFMILDAPPHHDAARVKSIQRSVKAAAAKGIALIPVVASGIDKNTEFLMRFMALSTNGTYVFLTDDSGIGNSHLKATVGSYQVEHLNQLLNRLINKYSGLESNVAGDLLSSSDKPDNLK
jgi:hypothetical protein